MLILTRSAAQVCSESKTPAELCIAVGGGIFFLNINRSVMVVGSFQGIAPPSSISGQIEAKVKLETSSLDAFIVQLLEGLQRMESVSRTLHKLKLE